MLNFSHYYDNSLWSTNDTYYAPIVSFLCSIIIDIKINIKDHRRQVYVDYKSEEAADNVVELTGIAGSHVFANL